MLQSSSRYNTGTLPSRQPFPATHGPRTYTLPPIKTKLNCRQAGWLDLLQSYCLEVEQIAGKDNIFPDAMSRRPDHAPSVKSIRLVMKT